jgi:hypothetical protein
VDLPLEDRELLADRRCVEAIRHRGHGTPHPVTGCCSASSVSAVTPSSARTPS